MSTARQSGLSDEIDSLLAAWDAATDEERHRMAVAYHMERALDTIRRENPDLLIRPGDGDDAVRELGPEAAYFPPLLRLWLRQRHDRRLGGVLRTQANRDQLAARNADIRRRASDVQVQHPSWTVNAVAKAVKTELPSPLSVRQIVSIIQGPKR